MSHCLRLFLFLFSYKLQIFFLSCHFHLTNLNNIFFIVLLFDNLTILIQCLMFYFISDLDCSSTLFLRFICSVLVFSLRQFRLGFIKHLSCFYPLMFFPYGLILHFPDFFDNDFSFLPCFPKRFIGFFFRFFIHFFFFFLESMPLFLQILF